MEAPVSALHGVMHSLPVKLSRLLPDSGFSLHKGEENKILGLKEHLEELVDKYLMKLSEVDASALTANCWVKEVRELSYDIDDFVDKLIEVDAETKIVGAVKRRTLFGKNKTIKLRKRWVADEISGFRRRMTEAIEQYIRYNLDEFKGQSGVHDSEEHGVLYPSHLVGLESSMEKVGGWLTDNAQQQLRVVSIVGIGGVGKTTLANQLYSKFGWRFECRAFVRTSRKPDMRSLLTSILLQVRRRHQPLDAADNVNNLINKIRAYLQDKKYFIIIDDLWASSTWDIVRRALPDGNCCSRVLTTTELDVVAQRCCRHNSEYILVSNKKEDSKCIFNIEPLSDEGSRQLFLSRAFGHQQECPGQLHKVSNEIIKRCGGLPLAIITAASVLTKQPYTIDQLSYIQNSLSFNLWMNPTLEGMKQVLNLCYNNLPRHLKACVLYLSICKEDYIVWKDDLVKQWIAEGFISTVEGKKHEEVAGNYFNDLVNRGMIQPVDISYSGEVLSCIIHYMVLSFLRYRSIQENLMTAIDHSQTDVFLADKVRRLSLHFGSAEDATTPVNMRLSQVRSLVFSGLFKCMPSITEFKLVKVLFLKLWVDSSDTSYDLNAISKIFRLRYLHIIACNLSLELPAEMQSFKDLMTLEIDAKVRSIPSDIVQMLGLLHLHLPAETNLPDNIGELTSLQSLGYYNLSSNSKESVLSLGELINLCDLHLTCCTVQPKYMESNMECLGSILGKLINLRSITLVPAASSDEHTLGNSGSSITNISCDGLGPISRPPVLLQRIELLPQHCIFSSLPKWIRELHKLRILKIGIRGLSATDIDILGGLPALTALTLYVHKALAKRIIIDKEAGFSVLKCFKFRCCVPLLTFEAGAMPKLWKLKLSFNAHGLNQHSAKLISIEQLPGLKEICVKFGGANVDEETVLVAAIGNHPSNPRINVKSVDWDFHGEEDRSMVTEKQQDEYPRTRDEGEGIVTPDQENKTLEEQDNNSRRYEKKQSTIVNHPSSPRINVKSVAWGFHGEEDQSMVTVKQEDEITEENPDEYCRTLDEYSGANESKQDGGIVTLDQENRTPEERDETNSWVSELPESSSCSSVPGMSS